MSETNYSYPEASGIPKDEVEKIAALIAEQLMYEPGGSLEDVVHSLGGKLTYQTIWELEATSSGSIQIEDEGNFEIFLAAHTGPTRDRFTIAHELGHYFLHYLIPKQVGRVSGPMRAMRYGSDRVEWEANWFAASFLMPANVFRTAYDAASGDSFVLSDQFGVSRQAVEIRAKALALSCSK